MNATVLPSAVSEKPLPIHSSRTGVRSIFRVAGSSVNRYDQVRCDAAKKMPAGVHATRSGSSSNASVRLCDGGRARRDDGDDAVLEEVERLAHRRHERDARAVGRPARVRVGPVLRRPRPIARAAGDVDDRDVGGAAVGRIARDAMVEGDGTCRRATSRSCRRRTLPLVSARVARVARSKHVQVGVALVLILELDVAPPLLAFLHRLGDRVGHRERDLRARRATTRSC